MRWVTSIRLAGARAVLRHCALALCLAWVSGCLSYPAVPAPADQPTGNPRISGSRGSLSQRDSAAILDALRKKSGDPDVLERHIALEEAVSATPLVAGNK